MIKAAALSYAIVFALIIGMLCSSVLLIASVQKKIEIHFTSQEHVLFDSYAAIQYAKNELSLNESSTIIHPSNDTSKIYKKAWGFLNIIHTITYNNFAKKKRQAICMESSRLKHPTIYLAGNYEGLKIAGETIIEGTCLLPNADLSSAYIPNTTRSQKNLIDGIIEKANVYLPPLKKTFQNFEIYPTLNDKKTVPFLEKDSTVNFSDLTLHMHSEKTIIVSKKYIGNIIISSLDSIYVKKDALLENCILFAPKVTFESGFIGSVQVFAKNKIVLEKNVVLKYPSFLSLNEQIPNNKNSIEIKEQAQLIGGILMTSQLYDHNQLVRLILREKSVVGGLIYCVGEIEHRGNVIGSLYTNKFTLDFGGSIYMNHLINSLNSSKRLPKNQSLPAWLIDESTITNEILCWI